MLRRHLLEEPKGDVWRGLLRALEQRAHVCVLVLDRRTKAKENRLCRQLAEAIVGDALATSWPGTTESEPRRVIRARFDRATSQALADAADSLFGLAAEWVGDVSFLAGDLREWLVSITHERICFVVATDEEWTTLHREVPGLRRISSSSV